MKSLKHVLIKLIELIGLLILWWALSRRVNNLFVPKPENVLRGFKDLSENSQLINGVLYSMGRVTLASILSGIVSVVLGLLIYSNEYIKEILLPIVKMLRYIPVTAFYPLLIMWCGIGEEMKVSFLFIVTFVSMLPSMVLIFTGINEDLIDTGRTIGMNEFDIISRVVLPATLPDIFQNFLLLISIGWTYVPFVETINAKYGLGYIIRQSSARGRTDLIFTTVITIVIISLIFDKGGHLIHKKLFRWKYLKGYDN